MSHFRLKIEHFRPQEFTLISFGFALDLLTLGAVLVCTLRPYTSFTYRHSTTRVFLPDLIGVYYSAIVVFGRGRLLYDFVLYSRLLVGGLTR